VSDYSKTKVDKAGRLFANQLENFARDPNLVLAEATIDQTREAIAVVEWWRSEHAKPLSRVAANLRYYVGEEGKPVVAQRLKRVPTIAGKLLREPAMKLSRMADIGGVRALLPDQAAAYRVAGRLRKNWTITRFRDYVSEPKADGYRALHLINRHRGRSIEIQLRTPHQDAWANLVETLSRDAIPGLKFGQGPAELRDFLFDYAEILARADLGLVSREEMLKLIEERAIALAKLQQSNEP
jgi:ppGpp synthetase/RelA/SpoT-type nucleotidyltranferase